MPPSQPRRPVRQAHIVDLLRRQIVSGKLSPGQRLPTRAVLQQRFDASSKTVQGALDELVRCGFVVTRGTLGTFVVDHPPHLHHYALVLFERLGRCCQFITTIANEAAAIGGGPTPRITVFHDVNVAPDNEPHRQLVAAAQAGRLAGVIVVFQPWSLRGSPLLDLPDLPRTLIMPHPFPEGDTVILDDSTMVTKAFGHFQARGRKRVAVIAGHGQDEPADALIATAARFGLTIRPYWVQRVAVAAATQARGCAHLLFHEGQDERPDALFIHDDNLTEHAVLGVLDAGIRIPHDLEIVTHCNFPTRGPSMVPITRLGFDTRRILTTAMSSLDRLRRGQAVDSVLIPAEFEQEVLARAEAESGPPASRT
jgi:DNA-binding LacI/PurR family transcriptional regulator